MILEKLLGEIVQVSAGGRVYIAVLREVAAGVIRLERVAMLVGTPQGTALEKLSDGPFEDSLIISGDFTVFEVREDSEVVKHYKATMAGIILPEGGGN